MTIFNFDMHRIGQTIARLRREHNMTQMQLADEMGVSFQAVSNWERGQSMPDISKLPELAELFGTTIDALLGRSIPVIEHAAEGKLDELPSLTVEEVAEAAPLLPPRQMDDLTDKLMALDNLPDMEDLLPYLPTSKVDALLKQRLNADGNLSQYAVFASTAAVDEAALALESQGKSIMQIVPFMSQHAVDHVARAREARKEDCTSLAPFLSNVALNDIVVSRLKSNRSISSLLPFISQEMLQRLFDAASTKD